MTNKQKETASGQDIIETQAEADAAVSLLNQVKSAIKTQDNITKREAEEIGNTYINALEDRYEAVQNNHGLHSKQAIAAMKETAKLLY